MKAIEDDRLGYRKQKQIESELSVPEKLAME